MIGLKLSTTEEEKDVKSLSDKEPEATDTVSKSCTERKGNP
jgi:hypothetical protein